MRTFYSIRGCLYQVSALIGDYDKRSLMRMSDFVLEYDTFYYLKKNRVSGSVEEHGEVFFELEDFISWANTELNVCPEDRPVIRGDVGVRYLDPNDIMCISNNMRSGKFPEFFLNNGVKSEPLVYVGY